MQETKLHQLEATDERQYMIREGYEVYEKQGAPLGAITFHYHSFYEVIYVLEGVLLHAGEPDLSYEKGGHAAHRL